MFKCNLLYRLAVLDKDLCTCVSKPESGHALPAVGLTTRLALVLRAHGYAASAHIKASHINSAFALASSACRFQRA